QRPSYASALQSFPTRRSSDLLFCTSTGVKHFVLGRWSVNGIVQLTSGFPLTISQSGDSMNTGSTSAPRPNLAPGARTLAVDTRTDRKSTRLNSSHQIISYAVF